MDPAAEAYGDEHPRFGFPNSSNDTAEVLDFLRVLKKNGFFNAKNPYILTFEVKPWANEDISTVIANCKRVLNRAWSLLEDCSPPLQNQTNPLPRHRREQGVFIIASRENP